MERFPNSDEHHHEWPKLDVDLSGPDGHWFNLISMARQQLEGDARKEFNQVIWEAMQHGSGKTYHDVLAIINSYMDLTDTSGLFETYAPKPPDEQAGARDALPQGPPSAAPNQPEETTQ